MIEIGTPSSHRITPRIDDLLSSITLTDAKTPIGDSKSPAEVLSCRKRTIASPQDHSPNAVVLAKFPGREERSFEHTAVAIPWRDTMAQNESLNVDTVDSGHCQEGSFSWPDLLCVPMS